MSGAAITAAIRVELPAHLRTLARVSSEVTVSAKLDGLGQVTTRSILDALEEKYPML